MMRASAAFVPSSSSCCRLGHTTYLQAWSDLFGNNNNNNNNPQQQEPEQEDKEEENNSQVPKPPSKKPPLTLVRRLSALANNQKDHEADAAPPPSSLPQQDLSWPSLPNVWQGGREKDQPKQDKVAVAPTTTTTTPLSNEFSWNNLWGNLGGKPFFLFNDDIVDDSARSARAVSKYEDEVAEDDTNEDWSWLFSFDVQAGVTEEEMQGVAATAALWAILIAHKPPQEVLWWTTSVVAFSYTQGLLPALVRATGYLARETALSSWEFWSDYAQGLDARRWTKQQQEFRRSLLSESLKQQQKQVQSKASVSPATTVKTLTTVTTTIKEKSAIAVEEKLAVRSEPAQPPKQTSVEPEPRTSETKIATTNKDETTNPKSIVVPKQEEDEDLPPQRRSKESPVERLPTTSESSIGTADTNDTTTPESISEPKQDEESQRQDLSPQVYSRGPQDQGLVRRQSTVVVADQEPETSNDPSPQEKKRGLARFFPRRRRSSSVTSTNSKDTVPRLLSDTELLETLNARGTQTAPKALEPQEQQRVQKIAQREAQIRNLREKEDTVSFARATATIAERGLENEGETKRKKQRLFGRVLSRVGRMFLRGKNNEP